MHGVTALKLTRWQRPSWPQRRSPEGLLHHAVMSPRVCVCRERRRLVTPFLYSRDECSLDFEMLRSRQRQEMTSASSRPRGPLLGHGDTGSQAGQGGPARQASRTGRKLRAGAGPAGHGAGRRRSPTAAASSRSCAPSWRGSEAAAVPRKPRASQKAAAHAPSQPRELGT